jgi:oxygen-independent coproporphyrinogen III oxidase
MARRKGRTIAGRRSAYDHTLASSVPRPTLGLYLHVPFCQAICTYCNFNRGLLDEALKTRYVAALEREILAAGEGQDADTVYFGGGTPSVLGAHEVARLIAACRTAYRVAPGAEITLETNPETASVERLGQWREAGVTRISFGAQSFDDDQLRRLGRIHDARRIAGAVAEARGAGFDNVSLDLMFWLPGQSRASWRTTVDTAIELRPDHVSLYLLELYPNAPLREAILRAASGVQSSGGAWAQAADDEAADMYLEALGRFDAAGLAQYEISNVARPGYESRHNLKYWTSGHWRGFGCGAHSTVGRRRWHNIASTTEFVARIEGSQSVASGLQQLTTDEQQQEALFTGMRLSRGIARAAFAEHFGVDPWPKYEEALAPASEAGLVWTTDAAFGLTRPGMLLANEILSVFV